MKIVSARTRRQRLGGPFAVDLQWWESRGVVLSGWKATRALSANAERAGAIQTAAGTGRTMLYSILGYRWSGRKLGIANDGALSMRALIEIFRA